MAPLTWFIYMSPSLCFPWLPPLCWRYQNTFSACTDTRDSAAYICAYAGGSDTGDVDNSGRSCVLRKIRDQEEPKTSSGKLCKYNSPPWVVIMMVWAECKRKQWKTTPIRKDVPCESLDVNIYYASDYVGLLLHSLYSLQQYDGCTNFWKQFPAYPYHC